MINTHTINRIINISLKYIMSATIFAVILGPIFVVLFTSLKTQIHMGTTSPIQLPPITEITFANYIKVFDNKQLIPAIRNTGFILSISIILNIVIGSISAYALQRFTFRFKKIVMACFFLGMLVPTFVVEIARFQVIQKLGFYNTLGAPIIIYVATDLMQLYLYMQFISKISVSLDESAIIDGCSYFGVFYRIIFPLLLPATATIAIIKMVTIINDMYIPYLYMPKTSLKTMTTFLMGYASAQQGSWPTLAAAIVVILIPTVLLYTVFHRKITEGLSAGAIKE